MKIGKSQPINRSYKKATNGSYRTETDNHQNKKKPNLLDELNRVEVTEDRISELEDRS